jgi:hypothetical protein
MCVESSYLQKQESGRRAILRVADNKAKTTSAVVPHRPK